MNPFYARKLIESQPIMELIDGKIVLNMQSAVWLARASGLRSKRRRKIMKRCKKILHKILRETHKRNN